MKKLFIFILLTFSLNTFASSDLSIVNPGNVTLITIEHNDIIDNLAIGSYSIVIRVVYTDQTTKEIPVCRVYEAEADELVERFQQTLDASKLNTTYVAVDLKITRYELCQNAIQSTDLKMIN